MRCFRNQLFIASFNPEPADFSDGAVSPKVGVSARVTDVVTVHAQYAGGFRAPPYSAINTGFTNPQGGYVTLPNPGLRAEASDNIEVGVRTVFDRASFGVTVFSNRYDDFIDLTTIGFNPRTRLLEFQSRNLEQAEINGVELRGEAYVTDRVMIRGSYARIDGVEISKDAAVPPLAAETPLGSIAPNEGVLGIRYLQPSGRWGSELSLRLVASYQGAPDEDQFAPAAYQVVDRLWCMAPDPHFGGHRRSAGPVAAAGARSTYEVEGASEIQDNVSRRELAGVRASARTAR